MAGRLEDCKCIGTRELARLKMLRYSAVGDAEDARRDLLEVTTLVICCPLLISGWQRSDGLISRLGRSTGLVVDICWCLRVVPLPCFIRLV
jgi:hypothetical protein